MMNTEKWIEYFEANRERRNPPAPRFIEPCQLPPGKARRRLASSLATFQLGESGEGRALQRFARRVAAERLPGYDRAAAMFVAEENRHADYLEAAVHYLGGELKSKQWTDFFFRRLRRLINLEFELQVLLTAEVIGMAYYALLADAVPDRGVRDLCRRLVADEVGHLRFHAEFFRGRLATMRPVLARAWHLQFRAIFQTVRTVAWWDHRRALAAYGIGRREFFRRSRRDRCWFEAEIDRGSPLADSVAVDAARP